MKLIQHYGRRYFLRTAAESAAFAAVALTLKPFVAIASVDRSSLTVYDPRFAAAEASARDLSNGGPVFPTGGDPTLLLLHLTSSEFLAIPGKVQGVTTESIPFCLLQLKLGIWLSQRRLDRDLFVWHMQRTVI